MRIMTLIRLVLDMSRSDRNTTLALFRSLIDILEVDLLGQTLMSLTSRNRSRQRRLTMIHVTNRTLRLTWGLFRSNFSFAIGLPSLLVSQSTPVGSLRRDRQRGVQNF